MPVIIVDVKHNRDIQIKSINLRQGGNSTCKVQGSRFKVQRARFKVGGGGLRNGELRRVLAVVEEERFPRVKHWAGFTEKAIRSRLLLYDVLLLVL